MDVPTIRRRPEGCSVPLSQLQANAWFLQRLDPASVAYHEIRLWRIDGAIDAAALRAAIFAVAIRQPMLRTRYVATEDGPIQVESRRSDQAASATGIGGSPFSIRR